MNLDPQKFFIGLMDFFSIILPGALITALLMDNAGPAVLGDERYATLRGTQAVAVFLFASYLLGHLIFLLGSWLDSLYDWARRNTLNAQIAGLARRGQLPPWPMRALIRLVFKGERNLAVERAARIKHKALGSLGAQGAINTFQWSKVLLNTQSPESFAVVQRFEADSKFFRSFSVALVLLLAAWPWQNRWPIGGIPIVIVLLLLALWRYMEQRLKATNQAYWSVITLTATAGKITLDQAEPSIDVRKRAGGVVFRSAGGKVEYLVVEASQDPDQWVLPKGHVEESEHPRQTAVREVLEETGVWARIVNDMYEVAYQADGTKVVVRYFLMQAVARGRRQDSDRQHRWLPLSEAIQVVTHPESRSLLQSGEQLRLATKQVADSRRRSRGSKRAKTP